jgi:surfeit locus 1 family protein
VRRIVPLLLAVLVAAVCVRLGVWQLHRLAERRAANDAARAKLALSPVDITDPARVPQDVAWQRVACAGRWDTTRAVLLRGRSLRGVPGVEVICALLVEGSSTAVLVDRGFLVAADAENAPLAGLLDTARTEVRGVAQVLRRERNQRDPARTRDEVPRVLQVRELSQDVAARFFPYPVAPLIVRQMPAHEDQGGWPRPLPPPPLDDGPHVSYAIQWFAFAVVALVAGGLVSARTRLAA